MQEWMRWFLVVFFPVSFGLVFLGRSLLVWWRTGTNPVVIRPTRDARGYVGRLFGVAQIALVASVILLATGQERLLGIFESLHRIELHLLGASLLVASTIWTFVAQVQMGDAWRIGIDEKNATELVTRGLFRFSRNPIFLALHVALLALFLALPSVVTLLSFAVGHIAINMQVYLEEEHMVALHGDGYDAYRKRVPRWL